MDYSKLSKQELSKIRSELRATANRRMANFEKLGKKDEMIKKYQPYKLFLEHSRETTSGRVLTGMKRNDSRNKMLSDIKLLEKMTTQETSTVTGARKVFKKQINEMSRRVARHTGISKAQARIKLGSQRYYDFLHSKEFKELSMINKKASQEAIDFYIKNADEYGDDAIMQHFDKYLLSDDEMTIKDVFPDDLQESKYLNVRDWKKSEFK